jgi:hypothetical protein
VTVNLLARAGRSGPNDRSSRQFRIGSPPAPRRKAPITWYLQMKSRSGHARPSHIYESYPEQATPRRRQIRGFDRTTLSRAYTNQMHGGDTSGLPRKADILCIDLDVRFANRDIRDLFYAALANTSAMSAWITWRPCRRCRRRCHVLSLPRFAQATPGLARTLHTSPGDT